MLIKLSSNVYNFMQGRSSQSGAGEKAMMNRYLASGLFLLACAWFFPVRAVAASSGTIFVDPLDAPALMVEHPEREPLIDITEQQGALTAVGPRGMIVTSQNGGLNWVQENVPVQSDLVAVTFINNKSGWVTGQDGVILHTEDGGKTWIEQINGISARKNFENYYRNLINQGNKEAISDLQDIQENFNSGPILPWLGIAFLSPTEGFVVGPFGDIAMTDDGGENWQPGLEHIQNPNFYNLNNIGIVGGHLYIVGEQGSVYMYNPTTKMFLSHQVPYNGSLFGLTGNKNVLVVFGLQGKIFRSVDDGVSWMQAKTPSNATIMDGIDLKNGDIVLVNIDGDVLLSRDEGISFYQIFVKQHTSFTAVSAWKDKLVMASLQGIYSISIKK